MIRLARPDIDEEDISAVAEVLRTGYLVQGEHVSHFEAEIAAMCGARHAIAVSNCTAALHLSLLAIGVSPGDIVAVAPYSWPATANVIELCGGQPRFVDIADDTYGMDPAMLRRALAELPRPRAIVVVHAFGRMAAIRELTAIAAEFDVPVIEDAACALGASVDGQAAGHWGAIGCFSFHPRKAVTTGEGGMIVTDDDTLAWKCRVARNHGQDPSQTPSPFIAAGYNLRLTEFQAALGSTQLRKLSRLVGVRRGRARRYGELLANLPLVLPNEGPAGAHVYQSYVLMLSQEAAGRRDSVIGALRTRGVETSIGTHHIPMLTYYRKKYGYTFNDCPVSAAISRRSLAIPMHSWLTDEEQREVAKAIGNAL